MDYEDLVKLISGDDLGKIYEWVKTSTSKDKEKALILTARLGLYGLTKVLLKNQAKVTINALNEALYNKNYELFAILLLANDDVKLHSEVLFKVAYSNDSELITKIFKLEMDKKQNGKEPRIKGIRGSSTQTR
ncbi:hypothetical protein YTPLAS21_19480 [Candidatus Nitrosocosmicus sp.]|nr:hypothetical protein YTPLAS21_19480 [Candidatus Nitrosocosmicus sp.]